MVKRPYILTVLAVLAALALFSAFQPVTAAEPHHVDLGHRTWCRLRPYGNLESLPVQKHGVSFTGLLRGRDPAPDSSTLVVPLRGFKFLSAYV